MVHVNISQGSFNQLIGGLLALAEFKLITSRASLTGGASWLDMLVLCPGIHLQQQAADLANGGELPATAAMTTGYVFRTENQAIVGYLQRAGRPGCLSTIMVSEAKHGGQNPFAVMQTTGVLSGLCYFLAMLLTVGTIVVMGAVFREWWTLGMLLLLVLARALNTFIFRQRSTLGWKGQPEPGVQGDLLILLSQDRWIRMQGLVDDIKAVTSGQWLYDLTPLQSVISAVATLLVFMTAAVSPFASVFGNIIVIGLLLVESVLLGLSNYLADGMLMYGKVLKVQGEPKQYARRLALADDLISQTGRDDWAVGLGMIKPENAKGVTKKDGKSPEKDEPTELEKKGKKVFL